MPDASVVIVTKDRREDVLRAIQSALAQSNTPEVLVIDDASTDGTSQAVRHAFPQVRLYTNPHPTGYIVQRNRAARLATTNVIFSLDDDAAFSTNLIIEHVLGEMCAHRRIGAVAIPAVDVNREKRPTRAAAADGTAYACETFRGCAYAVRRDVFLRLGGFREPLFHQGEERDFAIRLLAHGYVVRLGGSDPILHYESATRDLGRMDRYGRRNDILFVAWNVPSYAVPWHLIRMVLVGCQLAWQTRRPGIMFRGLAQGAVDAVRLRGFRRAVPYHVYRLNRRLRRPAGLPLDDTLATLDSAPLAD